ncbi:ABC transporter ATP-binding protein [Acidaminobacter sp. JC074]|uniref:ABC transporter ATP-binding protein n=1 Tax=Acidaminobacter sp. JC074 TaxID=2530199 RepID=UPI001F116AA4|nr:ABC transporter ATP-binding protein [Acidaminobacter sp. JC074]MCH4886729.1 ABC transporter ATP-binding protein [Acidaminobacter sp. JC074]
MIKVIDLKKSFETHHVLNGIQMNVEKGKIYGLVGSNGCGKTTVLKHIMGIYKPDEGQILYENVFIEKTDYLENVYYVQDDLFFPMNYSLDDLFSYEKMMYPNMSDEKYKKLVDFFKIDHGKKLRMLSKGQKKQAAFILAVASMTETILLDEIVDGLDAVVRKKFWKVILAEVMDRDLTIVISSHALTELDNICDTVGILHEGKIVREDNIDKLKEETKRIQFALKDPFIDEPSNDYQIIKTSLIGKVYFVTVKGDVESFRQDLYGKHDVLIYEELSMNLEEIFVTELGGLGYGTEEYNV